MFNSKKYALLAAIILTFVLLTGAVLAHGPGSDITFRSAEDEESQREIWRLRQRLVTLNEIYREKLGDGITGDELREVENNLLDLREELAELQTEERTAEGFWGRMNHRWGLWGCDYRDDSAGERDTRLYRRHGMRRHHW